MIRDSRRCATSAKSGKLSPKLNSDEKWRSVRFFVATVMRYELGVACVDLDSVLLHHEPEDRTFRLGRPLPLGRKLCALLELHGYQVVVLTSRPPYQHQAIARYLKTHNFKFWCVTHVKPPADAYFDDKAFRVPKNWL